MLRAFLEQSPGKAAEVAALRLKNAALQHRIAAVEQQLKDSDRLSGTAGLFGSLFRKYHVCMHQAYASEALWDSFLPWCGQRASGTERAVTA